MSERKQALSDNVLAEELSDLLRSSRPFFAALKRAIAQDNAQQLRNAADRLLAAAARGEPWAISALADRIDGKPKQQTELSGPDGGPAIALIERVIVDPKDAI